MFIDGNKLFIEGVRAYPLKIKLWLFTLVLFNGIIPLLFLPRISAAIVLSSALSGYILGICLCYQFGFGKILGLMHLPWVPMVVYQFQFLSYAKIDSAHDYWLLGSLLVSLVSLIIDFFDVQTHFLRS